MNNALIYLEDLLSYDDFSGLREYEDKILSCIRDNNYKYPNSPHL